MRKLTTAFVILTCLLCASAAAAGGAQAGDAADYKAVVRKDEARFTMPVPARDKWKWRMKESRERSREYAFDVKVVNEGQEYTFGFFLWKNPNSSQGSGSLSSLLAAGQKDVFQHTSAGLNTIIRDAGVSVRQKDGRLVITVSGRRNVERLFSGRPAEVTFQTQMPGEPPTSQTVPVVYEN
jgi:hypothetical protein